MAANVHTCASKGFRSEQTQICEDSRLIMLSHLWRWSKRKSLTMIYQHDHWEIIACAKKVWLRWTIIVGANPENCLKTTSIVGRLFANLGSEAKKSGIQQKTNIWDVSEGGREWKNFCDLEKLVNAKLPSCKGLRMGVHRNEEAAHSNLTSFHQHLVHQTITLETCSTFKLTFISHYIRKQSLWRNHSIRC